MSDPLVTVYVTNYNYGRYIRQALDSVYNQIFTDFELIIIDDGSTDDSRAIISEYEGRPSTRIIFQQNKGLNATNNIAVKAARGKYVMRLDADDYLDESALLVMTTLLESEPDLALVFPDWFYVDANGTITGQERRHNFQSDVTLMDQPAHGACTMIRRDCLIEVNAYAGEFRCQDGYDLWLKIIDRYPVRNINLPLFYYRRHNENLTNNQEFLLKTRSEILKAHAERASRPKLKTVCVIPVLGQAYDPKCMSLELLDGKTLLNIAISHALAAGNLDEVIVSSPDQKLLDMVAQSYGNRVTLHLRPREMSRENVPFEGAVLDAVAKRATPEVPDAIMVMTIDAPLRGSFYLEKAINVMRVFDDIDVVLGVLPDNDLFFQHDGGGLRPVGNNAMIGKMRFERDYLYRQTGGLLLARREFYEANGDKILSGRIGHFVLSRQAGMLVRSQLDLEIAKTILAYDKKK